ncbi:prolyl aminopeptidase [Patescibacteria group bacterium]
MNKLYKQYTANKKGFLQVSDVHKIYFEESGNPKGKPVIVLHGGPGSRCKPKYRRYFNPRKWRVVMFDQRGCGKSKPLGEIEDNTTWDLVDDIEKLRKYLKISKWLVFGGSWGSTLGLAYAEKYPSVVTGMILRGIWLCRKKDIEWLFGGEALRRLFPDLWERRAGAIKKLGAHDKNSMKILFGMLKGDREKDKKYVSAVFENWEGQFSKVGKAIRLFKQNEMTEREVVSNKMLMHYVLNNCFLQEDQLIKNAKKLPKVPMVIIHGRYDVVCPLDNAWDLKKAIPHATLEIVPGAGHHSSEKGIRDKLIEYADKFSN